MYSWSTGQTINPINVAPSTSTTYSVTATNSNGCIGTASRLVTVNPIPVASISPAAASVCAGQNQILVASEGIVTRGATVKRPLRLL